MINKEQNIQNLLDKINAAPDLGDNILTLIIPYILKANFLLKEDSFRTKNNQKSVFNNIEERFDVESILHKDLPNIVDLYVVLPLEYRNTVKLRNNLTHREMLLSNIETLINRFIQIEKNQNIENYEEIGHIALASTKFIKEKYNSLLDTENESNLQLETEFDFQKFKRENPDYQLDKSPLDMENITESDKKFTFKDDSVIVERKNKLRHFFKIMTSTGTKAADFLFSTKSKYSPVSVIKLLYNTAANNLFIIAGVLMVSAIGFKFYDAYDGGKVTRQLNEIETYTLAPSDSLLKINYSVLQELAKENENFSVDLVEGKNKIKLLNVQLKATSKQCMRVITNIQDDYKKHPDFNYYINEHLLQKKTKPGDRVLETICKLPQNNIQVYYHAQKPK